MLIAKNAIPELKATEVETIQGEIDEAIESEGSMPLVGNDTKNQDQAVQDPEGKPSNKDQDDQPSE
jgi:hypothetical protein